MSEVGERMNGGAVNEDRSPENEAILVINVRDKYGWEVSGSLLRERQIGAHDLRKEVQDPR